MSGSEKFGQLPQIKGAWEYPLFDAIMGRRSRRFGTGMEIKAGPFVYKSTRDPHPLNELETSMLVAAATATTGPLFGDMEYPGGIIKTVGRTVPSATGSNRTALFFSNDHGTYMVNSMADKVRKMQEYGSIDDRSKVVDFYKNCTTKLSDGRMDLPAKEPALFSHNHWVTNRPGSTVFMPVTDVTKDTIKFILNMVDSKNGRYVRETGGYTIVDDRKGMKPAGCEKWVKSGFLNKSKILPLSRLENLIVMSLISEGAFMSQNLQLALQATGIGGWTHAGFTSLFVLGGTPVCRGLGFRFTQSKSDPFPTPVGKDGVFEGYCPPYYKTMDDAVDAALAGLNMSMDEWEGKGMLKANKTPNQKYDDETVPASEEGIACTKDICRYIYEEYGKFPANHDSMNLLYFIQAHHLDTDFYDAHFKEGAYLETHRNHMRDWHGGE
jgi:hypothetical protein